MMIHKLQIVSVWWQTATETHSCCKFRCRQMIPDQMQRFKEVEEWKERNEDQKSWWCLMRLWVRQTTGGEKRIERRVKHSRGRQWDEIRSGLKQLNCIKLILRCLQRWRSSSTAGCVLCVAGKRSACTDHHSWMPRSSGCEDDAFANSNTQKAEWEAMKERGKSTLRKRRRGLPQRTTRMWGRGWEVKTELEEPCHHQTGNLSPLKGDRNRGRE